MLCAHLDTVGVEGMADPHTPRLEGDRLHGRGAYDMKSGLASALLACRDAPGDVIVAAVADEEHASLGVQEVLASYTADAAIVTEPTELELIVAHKGFVWLEIEVEGRAAHGSRHEEGVDAIVKAGPILTAIGELDADARRAHPSAARPRLRARLIDRGRRRDVELPRALHDRARAAHAARRDAGRRRGGVAAADQGRRAAHPARPGAVRRRPAAGDRASGARGGAGRRRSSPARPTGPTPPSSPPPASRPSCTARAAPAPTPSRSG